VIQAPEPATARPARVAARVMRRGAAARWRMRARARRVAPARRERRRTRRLRAM
jgi:hypothetical protein